MTNLAPKFNMARNPVYRVDFANLAAGKTLAATKRRVRFRFGFSNAEALDQGLTGTHCRGAEHEVTLVWSLTSGKRLVLADDEEVHYSKGSRSETRFETSWTMNGGHVVKLIAHAAPPLRHTPGFRQFDLQLDGLSYFDMPKIFELGVNSSRSMVASTPSNYANYSNYNLAPPQEEPYYETSVRRQEEISSVDRVATSRGFAESPPTVSTMSNDLMSDPIKGHVQDHLASPVSIMDSRMITQAASTYDEFTPVEPEAPSPAVVHNQILSAYQTPSTPPSQPAMLALANEPHTEAQPVTPYSQVPAPPVYSPTYESAPAALQYATPVQPAPFQEASVATTPTTPSSQPTLTMAAPLDLEKEEEPVSEMERALQTLVNFDDIATPMKTPQQRKKEEKLEQERKSRPKSEPLPPTKLAWHLGDKAALNDIKENAEPRAAPSKEVMRPNAFDPRAAHSGMMVVYGSPAPQLQPQGFGVPAQMAAYHNHMGYYHQQPQQAYAAY